MEHAIGHLQYVFPRDPAYLEGEIGDLLTKTLRAGAGKVECPFEKHLGAGDDQCIW